MKRILIVTLALSVYLGSPVNAGASNLFELAGITQPATPVPAPDFSLATLGDDAAKLSDYRGKVVLLNFWATWCTPCREEMPAMEALWDQLKADGFVILAVSGDKGSPKKVQKYVDSMALSFPILLDPSGDVRATYEVPGLPTSYLIGKDGKIAGRVIGIIDWAHENAIAAVQQMLAE